MTSHGTIIDGQQIATNTLNDLREKIDKLKESNITPTLGIILVGNNKSSESYIKQKQLKAEMIGAKIKLFRFESITQEELLEKIEELNSDTSIHGIIIQRPLPASIDRELLSRAVSTEKDVDGFNDESMFDAPVALAVLEILKSIGLEDLNNKKIVVIGKGETAGKPIIKLLDKKEFSFEVIDSKTESPKKIIKNSDIIISAVGKKNTIKGEWLNKNQVLIGVGLTLENGKLVGDYETDEIKEKVKFYTPRIGGVGPVNVAFLMQNLIHAAILHESEK